MKFYIKQWDDSRVSLMTELGDVLASFSSIQDAMRVCAAWNLFNENDAFHNVLIQGSHTSKPVLTAIHG